MGVEIHSHNKLKSLMGLSSATRLFSLFPTSVLHKRKNNSFDNSKLVVGLAVFLAIASLCECTSENDQPATQQKQLNVYGQRLVRRNFLRFGKRSGTDAVLNSDDEDDDADYDDVFGNYKLMKREDPAPTGPGEQYAAMLMGKGKPHSTSARSFLRFGRSGGLSPTQSMAASKRRADNFLRFGKRIPDDHREEQLLGRWKKFLLVMLAKVAEEEDELLHQKQAIYKKSSDFLRFG